MQDIFEVPLPIEANAPGVDLISLLQQGEVFLEAADADCQIALSGYHIDERGMVLTAARLITFPPNKVVEAHDLRPGDEVDAAFRRGTALTPTEPLNLALRERYGEWNKLQLCLKTVGRVSVRPPQDSEDAPIGFHPDKTSARVAALTPATSKPRRFDKVG